MKQKAFFIIFKGLSLKQIKRFFFFEGECPTLMGATFAPNLVSRDFRKKKYFH